MKYVIPHYYKDFRCIAGTCPDTCCASWQIVIDKKTLKKYKKIKAPLGNRIHNSVDWKNGCFKQYSRKCAFLGEEGLCDLYSEGGSGLLCDTCKMYPRHVEEFEGVREISLSLSCPEAARIVLECEEPVKFLVFEKEGEETYKDFDNLLYDKLLSLREHMIDILQRRGLPLRIRLAMVLALSHDVQTRIDRRQIFGIDELLKKYEKPEAPEWFELRMKSLKAGNQLSGNLFSLFGKLEVLNSKWPAYISKTEKILADTDAKEKLSCFENQCEQLAVYFLFTYLCGAVYDGEVYNKVKFAIMSVIWTREMAKAFWKEQGQLPCSADFTRIVFKYCKEIEHSDLNLNRIFRLLADEKTYSLENIMELL